MTNPLLEPGDDAAPSLPQPEAEVKAEVKPEVTHEEPRLDTKPEVKPEGDDPETKYNKVRTALREERQAAAALKRQLDEYQTQIRQFDSLKSELDEHRKKRAEEDEKKRFESDPALYLKDQIDQLGKRTQEISDQSLRANQEQVQQAQFMQAVQSQTAAYAKDVPDYSDAFEFIHGRRLKEYDALGVPEEQWELRFQQESIDFARVALSQGRNPAELVYKMAGVWGYTKSGAQKTGKPETEIERLNAGQAAAATLSKGGHPEESMLKSVEKMSDAEFDKYWDEQVKPARKS